MPLKKNRTYLFTVFMCFIGVVALAQTERPKPEQFSANVYAQTGVFAGRMTQIDIYIDGYTSDDEAKQLRTLLKTKGEDALLRQWRR
jgi:hypothetical protein